MDQIKKNGSKCTLQPLPVIPNLSQQNKYKPATQSLKECIFVKKKKKSKTNASYHLNVNIFSI